jgi:hypothetical protein
VLTALSLSLLLLLLLFLAYHTLRVRAGQARPMRQISGYRELSNLVAESAESGRPLHVSVGVAGVGNAATAETWAGLTLLAHLAEEAAAHGIPILVSVSDATALPIAEDLVYSAYGRVGRHDLARSASQVRLIAPSPMAYAAGAMGLLSRQPLAGNVMVGSFGDEVLLITETGAGRGLFQVVGSADPQTLSLVRVSADETLAGEEIFAGGAYTARQPAHATAASLLAADWFRWVLIAGIIAAALWKLLT